MMEDERSMYNVVTIKNIDVEDFTFQVNNESFLIRAGETRNFPKFMAKLGVKHLIDKLLNKKDEEGSLVANKDERAALADQIVVNEQVYEKPVMPTDLEIVEEMNESDIDSVLKRNKNRLTASEEIVPPPAPDLTELETPKTEETKEEEKPEEDFAGLKQDLPPRAEMLKYAKNTLKMDLEDKKTKGKIDKLTDAELYEELGMDA